MLAEIQTGVVLVGFQEQAAASQLHLSSLSLGLPQEQPGKRRGTPGRPGTVVLRDFAAGFLLAAWTRVQEAACSAAGVGHLSLGCLLSSHPWIPATWAAGKLPPPWRVSRGGAVLLDLAGASHGLLASAPAASVQGVPAPGESFFHHSIKKQTNLNAEVQGIVFRAKLLKLTSTGKPLDCLMYSIPSLSY